MNFFILLTPGSFVPSEKSGLSLVMEIMLTFITTVLKDDLDEAIIMNAVIGYH